MPKLKTNRGAAKRFTATKSGRIKHKNARMRHNLGLKTRARKRRLRATGAVSKCDVRSIRGLMPYR